MALHLDHYNAAVLCVSMFAFEIKPASTSAVCRSITALRRGRNQSCHRDKKHARVRGYHAIGLSLCLGVGCLSRAGRQGSEGIIAALDDALPSGFLRTKNFYLTSHTCS